MARPVAGSLKQPVDLLTGFEGLRVWLFSLGAEWPAYTPMTLFEDMQGRKLYTSKDVVIMAYAHSVARSLGNRWPPRADPRTVAKNIMIHRQMVLEGLGQCVTHCLGVQAAIEHGIVSPVRAKVGREPEG